jgi:hypothetical protein
LEGLDIGSEAWTETRNDGAPPTVNHKYEKLGISNRTMLAALAASSETQMMVIAPAP